jgi:hypothetical protein
VLFGQPTSRPTAAHDQLSSTRSSARSRCASLRRLRVLPAATAATDAATTVMLGHATSASASRGSSCPRETRSPLSRAPPGETTDADAAHVSKSWSDLQKSWSEHVAKMHRDTDAKKAERNAKKAERRAEDAEGDTLFAIDYAYGTVEEAEYAVLDAISARLEADELATS